VDTPRPAEGDEDDEGSGAQGLSSTRNYDVEAWTGPMPSDPGEVAALPPGLPGSRRPQLDRTDPSRQLTMAYHLQPDEWPSSKPHLEWSESDGRPGRPVGEADRH